jgi:dihydrofolate reductase
MMIVNIIAAIEKYGGIGKKGAMPWPHMKHDMEHFMKKTTTGKCAVVMGRKTWESLPERHRPLKGRLNIVLSSTGEVSGDVCVVSDISAALKVARDAGIENCWIIGGGKVYGSAFNCRAVSKSIEKVFLTEFEHHDGNCDSFFPMGDMCAQGFVLEKKGQRHEENGYSYRINEYSKKKD